MTTTNGLSRRRRGTRVAGYVVGGIVAAYGLLVVTTLSPGLACVLVVAAVVVLDGLLLVLAVKRRSLGVAVRCGMVAPFAALVQAFGVYIPFRWDALAPASDGGLWLGSALAVALVLGVGLLVRRTSRPYGWAVLIGSAQGFVASFLVVLAAFAAAMGAD